MNNWQIFTRQYWNLNESLGARKRFFLFLTAAAILVVFVFAFIFLLLPPGNFPTNTMVTVTKGESLRELSASLKEKGIIRSSVFLNNIVIMNRGERKVIAGDYLFDEPLSVFQIARRITRGEFGLEPLKITFPEGLNVFEVAEISRANLIQFDPVEFLEKARQNEGYLFPDTYLFLSNAKASDVISKMRDNFDLKMKDLEEEIRRSNHSLKEIIVMASIIEEEAITYSDKKIVSGILWKRIENKMSLAVDSTFKYINGKNTYEITSDDLKIDSPYNTHKNLGLPPTPISNPGMESILAAIHPDPTKYFYFLSDRKGNMYYARNFDEHKLNKAKYFNK